LALCGVLELFELVRQRTIRVHSNRRLRELD